MLTWKRLASFPYLATELGGGEVPASIRALHGRPARVRGHMLVLKTSDEMTVTRFVLTRYLNGCCAFGTLPRLNEWIIVEPPAGGTAPVGPEMIEVEGTLEVGVETYDEAGVAISMYRMTARSVRVVPIDHQRGPR